MEDKTKQLDEWFERKMTEYVEAHKNDPDAKQKAELQTKYGKAFIESVESAVSKGQKIDTAQNEFGKFAMTILRANNDKEKAYSIAKTTYPDDKFLHECFKALTVSTPSEGGFDVPEVLSSDVIQFLYPKLAYSRLGSRRVDMPNGNLNLPRFDARASVTYIGETGKIAETKPKIGNLRGSSKKAAALIPISNDLIRSANPTFDAFVRDDLVMGVQLSRDYYAFYGPGTASSPAGIDTQLTSDEKQGSSSTTFTPDRPGEIKGMLMAKNVPMISPGWAFSGWVWTWLYNMKTSTGAYIYRDEMNQGKLLGDPFVVSNQIKTSNSGAPSSSDYGDIFYGDWSEFIEFVQLDMELMAFKEMSFVDSDGNTVSAAQQDLTVLRAISLHDFGLRHKESFVEATYKYSLT